MQLLIAKETRISQGKGCLSFSRGGPNANSYRNLIALVISQGEGFGSLPPPLDLPLQVQLSYASICVCLSEFCMCSEDSDETVRMRRLV